jgi:hypothetical protein
MLDLKRRWQAQDTGESDKCRSDGIPYLHDNKFSRLAGASTIGSIISPLMPQFIIYLPREQLVSIDVEPSGSGA